MNDRKNLAIFLRQGFYHGIKGGFFSALVFFVLLVCILGILSGSFKGFFSILLLSPVMLAFAIPLGFFPAIFIGMILGLIIAVLLYKFRSRFNKKWSLFINILISEAVALSAIMFWWMFVINRFKFDGLEFVPSIWFLIFLPFCIGTVIYIHEKLERFILEFGDLFNG